MKRIAPLFLFACSDSSGPSTARPTDAVTVDAKAQGLVRLPVPAGGIARATYLSLASASQVDAGGDPKACRAWDLAFSGYDIHTNSGPSGSGAGGAIGPLPADVFTSGKAPAIPVLVQDATGGAFASWYDYEGPPAHALWSRYHVYGVREGDRLWKLQVLSYYGEREGAPVPALYTIRVAEITPGHAGDIQELTGIDAAAGGSMGPKDAPSACLRLSDAKRLELSPDEVRQSKDWHLCFRRQTISVNGGLGGPGSITAVDLDAQAAHGEVLEAIKARTAKGEAARFASITAGDFQSSMFQGDRVTTPFDGWTTGSGEGALPVPGTWLVAAADGKARYLVSFAGFEGATDAGPGTVLLRVKPAN